MVSRELFRSLGRVGAITSALCVEYRVRNKFHIQRIRIVIDQELLKALDRVAQRTERNRSELICEALREHLRRLESGPWKIGTAMVMPPRNLRWRNLPTGRQRRHGL